MEKIDKPGFVVACTFIVLCAIAMAVALLKSLPEEVLANDGLSGWVEAIGTILAILGAFIVGSRQSKAAEAISLGIDRAAWQRKQSAILEIAAVANTYAKSIYDTFATDTFDIYKIDGCSTTAIRGVLDALSQIPLLDLNSVQAVSALLSMKENMSHLQDMITRIFDALNARDQVVFDKILPHGESFASHYIRGKCVEVQEQHRAFVAAYSKMKPLRGLRQRRHE